jgi:hypothetical protein
MNSSFVGSNIQLDSLKSDYLEALAVYKYSHSEESLDRLNAIKEAYVTFIEDDKVHNICVVDILGETSK